jgi:hypothetical protein
MEAFRFRGSGFRHSLFFVSHAPARSKTHWVFAAHKKGAQTMAQSLTWHSAKLSLKKAAAQTSVVKRKIKKARLAPFKSYKS